MREISIAIRQADLGPEQPEIGLSAQDLALFNDKGKIRVDVLIDGELVETRKDRDSVVFTTYLDHDDDVATVVVATDKVLSVLRYGKDGKIPDPSAGDEVELMRGFGEIVRRARDMPDGKSDR